MLDSCQLSFELLNLPVLLTFWPKFYDFFTFGDEDWLMFGSEPPQAVTEFVSLWACECVDVGAWVPWILLILLDRRGSIHTPCIIMISLFLYMVSSSMTRVCADTWRVLHNVCMAHVCCEGNQLALVNAPAASAVELCAWCYNDCRITASGLLA